MRLLRKEVDSIINILINSIFISFLLVLITFVSFTYCIPIVDSVALLVFIAIIIVLLWFVYIREGYEVFLVSSVIFAVSLFFIGISATLILSVLFFVSPFYYKLKKQPLPNVIEGFHLSRIDKKDVLYGIVLFFVIMLISMALSQLARDVGLDDSQKVYEKLIGIPPLLLFMVVLIGSVGEEIFFRAFLVEEIGPFVSSVFFVAAHVVYGSMYELLVVLPIGFIFSYFYYYKRRIYPTIIAHLIFNILMFVLLFSSGVVEYNNI